MINSKQIRLGMVGGGIDANIGEAYRFAAASKILESSLFTPIQYIQLVVGFVMGYLFFGDLPDIYEIIGSIVIMFSGLFIIYRENQLRITSLLNRSNKIKDSLFRGF